MIDEFRLRSRSMRRLHSDGRAGHRTSAEGEVRLSPQIRWTPSALVSNGKKPKCNKHLVGQLRFICSSVDLEDRQPYT
jgi:hypothetical protein